MQVLRNPEFDKKNVPEGMMNILNQQPMLPYFGDDILESDTIRGISNILRVLEDHEIIDDVERMEDNEPKMDISHDPRYDPILEELSETCDEALREYKSWRSPKFTGRFKYDNRLEQELDVFATEKTRIFAKDIGRLVERLISLGYNQNHFIIKTVDENGKKVLRSFRNVILDIGNADDKKAPELLSELITFIKPMLPHQIRFVEERIVSPYMADVANIKEKGQ